MKLLLVEDERDLSNVIIQVLKMNNYDVDSAYDGEEALLFANKYEYDVIILDWMIPKIDGVSVVKSLRENNNNVPVIILTAKSEIDDRVLGLDSGADDYLTKPFVIKELLARIRALSRRNKELYSSLKFGNLELIPNTFELKAINSVRLTNKEYKLMEFFIRNHDVLLSTERIFEYVWNFDTEAELNVVWVFISSLRKKMKAIGANCTISASRGLGYRLEEYHDKKITQ